jgi:ribosomal protein S18 acetylase RimI-like enzyme
VIIAEARLSGSWLSELSIRHVSQADLPSLEWEGEFAHFRRVYEGVFQRALRGQAVLWVAEREPSFLVGQLFVLLKSKHDSELADGATRALVHSFRVRPGFRRAGLGSLLLETAEEDLAQRGFNWVMLNVAFENTGAQKLYESRGYQRIRTISGSWSYIDHLGTQREVCEPGWRMGKPLAPGT